MMSGQGCPDDCRHALKTLAATGHLRRYDGPFLSGDVRPDAWLLTFVGYEAAADLMGKRWVRDRLEDIPTAENGRSI